MGIIIAVANNKGGTGKTTVACNLAHAIAKIGKNVLVVDMDSQCNATSLLISRDFSSRYSLYELLNPEGPDIPIENCIFPTKYEKVSCLPNVSETASLEPDLINAAPDSFFILRNKLRPYAQTNFDFTFIDNPPNMGTFVLCSLYASDFVIVPNMAGSKFSLEGLIKAIKLIDKVRENGNPDLKFLRLLLNQVDRRTSSSRTTIEYIRRHFSEDKVFETTIPVNATFHKAEEKDQTIIKVDSASPGAKAYRELAKELIEIYCE